MKYRLAALPLALLSTAALAQSAPLLMSCAFKNVKPAAGYVLLSETEPILVDAVQPRFLQISAQIPWNPVQHAAIRVSRASGALTGAAYAYQVPVPTPAQAEGPDTLRFDTGKVSGEVARTPSPAAYAFVPTASDQDGRDPAFSQSQGALTAADASIFSALDKTYCFVGDPIAAVRDLQGLPDAAARKPRLQDGRVTFDRDLYTGCARYERPNYDVGDVCAEPVYETNGETLSLSRCGS
jgi:hypothetical protein